MKKNQTSNGFPTRNGGTAKLLVSFSSTEGSDHYFYSSTLAGGEVSQLCTVPGCNKGTTTNPCLCYLSDPVNGVSCFSNGKDVFVLNPATGDILTLPKSKLAASVDGYVKKDTLVNLPYSVYAFGFDASKQEFKVLHVSGLPQSPGSPLLYNQQCEVFTVRIKKDEGEKEREIKKEEDEKPKELEVKQEVKGKHKGEKKGEEEKKVVDEGDVWRKAVSLPPCPYMFRGQGVFVNGSIYWIGNSSPREQAIVSFDVGSEMFGFIPIPFTLLKRPTLAHIRGRLAIQGLIEEAPGCSPTLGVWILEDIKEQKWVRNTVDIINPKHQPGVKFHVLVGDDWTGDMAVMRGVEPEKYEVVCLSGNKKTLAERTIKLGGLPSWVDLEQKGNNLNFRISNYVETKVPLDPIVVKVEEEKKPEVKEDNNGAKKVAQTKQVSSVQSRPAQKTQAQPTRQAQSAQKTKFGRAQPPPQATQGRGGGVQQPARGGQPAQMTNDGRAQQPHPKARGAQAEQVQKPQPAQRTQYGRAPDQDARYATQIWNLLDF